MRLGRRLYGEKTSSSSRVRFFGSQYTKWENKESGTGVGKKTRLGACSLQLTLEAAWRCI